MRVPTNSLPLCQAGGAGDRIRTRDPRSTKPMLYQLSYTSVRTPSFRGVSSVYFGAMAMTGLEPATRISVAALPTELHYHIWSWDSESNRRPEQYEGSALPTELSQHRANLRSLNRTSFYDYTQDRSVYISDPKVFAQNGNVERHTGFEPTQPVWKTGMLTIKHQCRRGNNKKH